MRLLEGFMYRMHPQVARLQGLLTHGVIGDVRLIAPLWRVRPYVFAGVGYNWMSVVYGDGNPQASPLRSSSRSRTQKLVLAA
mgnify:CR=1 FL=1